MSLKLRLPRSSEGTEPTRSTFALIVSAVLVGIAGCSAFTRIPPAAAPAHNITATPLATHGAPSRAGGRACSTELQVLSTAARPLSGRLPLIPGLTITAVRRTASGSLYTGFLKGGPNSLTSYLSGATGVLRQDGYTILAKGRPRSVVSSGWMKGHARGAVSVHVLCQGFIGVDYLVTATGFVATRQ